MNIVDFPDKLLTNIFYYLQDEEVLTFGKASQKANKIATDEIVRRDQLLDELLKPYTISRTFNITSSKEADIFLIGDVHDNRECKDTQAALINFWSWRRPVILIIEATPNNEQIAPLLYEEEEKEIFLKENSLSFGNNVHILGWDNKEADSVTIDMRKQIKILKEMSNCNDKFYKLAGELTDNESKQLEMLIKNSETEVSTLLQMPVSVLKTYNAFIKVKKLFFR